jgi:catechol 2,3-dioxygenase-like lactoylglutathione lyase family enzyme
MSSKGFSHIGLSTLDQDKIRPFYEGVLGFKPVVSKNQGSGLPSASVVRCRARSAHRLSGDKPPDMPTATLASGPPGLAQLRPPQSLLPSTFFDGGRRRTQKSPLFQRQHKRPKA